MKTAILAVLKRLRGDRPVTAPAPVEAEAPQRQALQRIAHDFNNSLSPILGFSELLMRPERAYDKAEVETFGRLINTAARDATSTVRRLRQLYAERAESAPADATTAADRVRRLRILVVDDEPLQRRVLAAQLGEDGHTVDTATNGAEALDKFLAGWFDLVITDRTMPEMNGDRLAAAIHQFAPGKPVVMLTALGDLMIADGERPVGVTVVVTKPATAEQLRHALVQAIGGTLVEQ